MPRLATKMLVKRARKTKRTRKRKRVRKMANCMLVRFSIKLKLKRLTILMVCPSSLSDKTFLILKQSLMIKYKLVIT